MSWMTQDWTMGELNALVKKIGESNARAILANKTKIAFDAVINRILCLLEVVIIGATDGKEMIVKAKVVFQGYIDPDFQKWELNVEGGAKPQTAVEVYEMVKDGKFTEIFNDFGVPLDRLLLTQHQIVRFCRDNGHLLRQDGYATFFLFKENNRFFVARMGVIGGKLEAYVRELGLDDVWHGGCRHRVVVPQN